MFANNKTKRGGVGIEEKSGKLRVRLPRTVAEGSQRYVSTGLDATPDNYRKVQKKVFEVEDLLETGRATLEQVKDILKFRPVLISLPTSKQYITDLTVLWGMYSEYMRNQVKSTTYREIYNGRCSNHIKRLPHKDVFQVIEIKDYLLKTRSVGTAVVVLRYISSCCRWAVASGYLPSNPFAGVLDSIKVPKQHYSPDPFTAKERDAIIHAFEHDPKCSNYAPFIKFLFLTGCRTGEAIGLQWKHINHDASQIRFSVTYDRHTRNHVATKTGVTRIFPCNKQLQSLLLSIRPETYDNNSPVFPSKSGRYINLCTFESTYWRGNHTSSRTINGKTYTYTTKGIVTELVEQGKVHRYRKLYCARHTFITMMLEAGLTATEVASLVGNSAKVIMEHYAGSCRPITVPEL